VEEPVTAVVHVPVRVCDVGGWTDTWFAGHGRVCSLAVGPAVSVHVWAVPGGGAVTVDAADYGVTFTVGEEPPEHRLLAEAIREAGPVEGLDVRLRVASAVPPSTSLGTSAAVCVGIIAALDALRGAVRPPGALGAAAHRAEAGRFGRQSGVQDQLAAAHGGANVIDIVRYPDVEVRPVAPPPPFMASLDRCLAHIAYGSPHDSSAVHEEVITVLAGEGPASPRLERLRHLAGEAEQALVAADLDRYGRVLTAATGGQAALHPALISDAAHELIGLARSCGAAGWKVNGAGGGGGSISILCRQEADRDGLLEGAARLGHTPLALALAHRGAHVG
jgi:D-glycero-alpha-D-manno-heptose-7-phosphate kinase